MRDDYYEYNDIQNEKIVNERKQQKKKAINNFAKDKLKKVVRTSVQTCMIGSLSDYEEFFGEIWGHGKHYNELTDMEKDLRNRWMECRDSILKRGNNGIRISENEINKCEISGYPVNKYKTVIKSEERNGRR